jgi:hypothetical protein
MSEIVVRGGGHLTVETEAIFAEDVATNQAMGRLGAELIPDRARVMTHCNAGALATAGYGSALGVVRAVWRQAGGHRGTRNRYSVAALRKVLSRHGGLPAVFAAYAAALTAPHRAFDEGADIAVTLAAERAEGVLLGRPAASPSAAEVPA